MPLTPDQLSAALEAKVLRSRMGLAERVATLWETTRIDWLRDRLAAQYRSWIGIHPGDRQTLRDALDRVIAGGGVPVRDLIAAFSRPDQTKGSASVRWGSS